MNMKVTVRTPAAGPTDGWGLFRSRSLRTVRRHLETFWHWWTGELRPLMPPALKLLLFRERLRDIIELDGDLLRISRSDGGSPLRVPLNTVKTENLHSSGAMERVLVLPRSRVIRRRAVLPLATEENLLEVLAFEMDRLTPFTVDQVYYDARITDRDVGSRMLTLELLVAPRREIDPLLARLRDIGLAPDVVTSPGDSEAEPLPLNLLPDAGRAAWRTVTRINVAVGLIAVLLLGVAVSLPLIEKQRRLSELEPQLAQAISDAAYARDLERQVDRLVAGSSYLIQKKRQEVSVLDTLNALTMVLPEDTWVDRFDAERGSVQIQGLSTSAEALIGLLERSERFENVRFESAVVGHEKQAVDRFHISADIESGEPHD